MSFTESIIKKFVTQCLLHIENLINNETSTMFKNEIFNYLNNEQFSQVFGCLFESGIRSFAEIYYKLLCKSGDSRNIMDDDNHFFDFWAMFNHECKLTRRKYTEVRHYLIKPHWYTSRGGSSSNKRNFICVEIEYENNVFRFTKVYVSFQKISYNDIKGTSITEDLIKANSFMINLHEED